MLSTVLLLLEGANGLVMSGVRVSAPPAASHMRRALMFFKPESTGAADGDACHSLSDRQRAAISEPLHEMLHDPAVENLVFECAEPSEDPTVTCFLAPESWVTSANAEGSGLQGDRYLCMPQTRHMSDDVDAEDGY